MRPQHTANVFWSGFEAISAVLSFASVFFVARLIGPAEVGIGAAAVAVHVLLWVTVNALFADALVQRISLEEARSPLPLLPAWRSAASQRPYGRGWCPTCLAIGR